MRERGYGGGYPALNTVTLNRGRGRGDGGEERGVERRGERRYGEGEERGGVERGVRRILMSETVLTIPARNSNDCRSFPKYPSTVR